MNLQMSLPFSEAQFLEIFHQYNDWVWPAQGLLVAVAVVAVVAAVRGGKVASRIANGILAALWIWTGVVYHLAYFIAINPAALVFGLLFIAEGVVIAWLGLARSSIRFERRPTWVTVTGVAIVLYALFVYPLLGMALGHRYPSAPTFGVPCPTTIFTFGLIVLSAPPRTRTAALIPAVWALLGLSAALQLGMWEDLGLIASAAIALIVVFVQRPRNHPAPPVHSGVAAAAR